MRAGGKEANKAMALSVESLFQIQILHTFSNEDTTHISVFCINLFVIVIPLYKIATIIWQF